MTLLIIVCVLSPKLVCAEEIEITEKQYSEKYLEWLDLPEEERNNTIAPPMYIRDIEDSKTETQIKMYSVYLGSPPEYNLRNELNDLKIKDQQLTNQCWAFSTTTQVESYMQKNMQMNLELSPRHIEYTTSRTFLDGINNDGFYREVNSRRQFLSLICLHDKWQRTYTRKRYAICK